MTALLNSTQSIEQLRVAQYDQARAFYDGTGQWQTNAQRNETRLTINYARALIRKITSYTYPEPVTFEIPAPIDKPAADTSAAEVILNQVLANIGSGELDPRLLTESATIGDAAVKVTWDPRRKRPVVAQIDPAQLSVIFDPASPDDALHVTHKYRLAASLIPSTTGVDYPVADPKQEISIEEVWTPNTWSLSIAGTIVRQEANPYTWIPYLVIANERQPRQFWGVSDLQDLYDVCRQINQRTSVLTQILELSGSPIAVLENVDGSEGIRVAPGSKWELPEGSKAYLLDLLSNGGVDLHIKTIELLFRNLFDLAETPRTAFGDSGRTISGAALEVEIQPAVQKVRRKRQQMTGYYRRRNDRVMDLLERFGGITAFHGLRETTPSWPPILPSDEESIVTNQVALVSNNIISRKTAAATLQLHDPDAELAQILAEEKAIAGIDAPESPERRETEA